MQKEAKARIKTNKLLEESGWRFFDEDSKRSNIEFAPNVYIKQTNFDKIFGSKNVLLS